jgi:biotin operon repressor
VSTTADKIQDTNYQFAMIYYPIMDLLNGNSELVGMYMCLHRFTNQQTMTAFPSIETLAEATGKSKNTVNKYLDQLQSRGVIKIKKRYNQKGRQISNLYQFVSAHEAAKRLEAQNLWGSIFEGLGFKNCTPRDSKTAPLGGQNLRTNYIHLTIPTITKSIELEKDIQPTAGDASRRNSDDENLQAFFQDEQQLGVKDGDDYPPADDADTPMLEDANQIVVTQFTNSEQQTLGSSSKTTKNTETQSLPKSSSPNTQDVQAQDTPSKPQLDNYHLALLATTMAYDMQIPTKLDGDYNGLIKQLEPQLRGRAKKGIRADFNVEPGLSPEAIVGFGIWWRKKQEGASMPRRAESLQEGAYLYQGSRQFAQACRLGIRDLNQVLSKHGWALLPADDEDDVPPEKRIRTYTPEQQEAIIQEARRALVEKTSIRNLQKPQGGES